MTKTPRIQILALACLGLWLAGRLPAQQQPVVPDFGPPVLRDWVQPQYPAEAGKAKREGTVKVEFVVETDGSVSREKVKEGTDEAFGDAALAAVRQWKFKPALENGEPAAGAMQVKVVFQLAQLRQKSVPLFPPEILLPQPMKEVPAKAAISIAPAYPAELEESKMSGEVQMEFVVSEAGKVEQPRVLWATHPALVEVSLRALERAEFTPAHQGPLAKSSRHQYPVTFESPGAKTADILAANHLSVVSPEAPEVLPRPVMLFQPVYPHARYLARETGNVTIEFTLDDKGQPTDITLVAADRPDFGPALTAAIEAWAFKPAQGANGPIPVRLRVTHEFALLYDQPEFRLAEAQKPGGPGIGGPAGLDRKLQPLWRGFPAYPQAFMKAPRNGQAVIEFIIDREGRARLPKILSATEEAFGWAAATAISQWVFERPTKGGEPVDITVRIPVGFNPPGE